jgi:hypothetical protein
MSYYRIVTNDSNNHYAHTLMTRDNLTPSAHGFYHGEKTLWQSNLAMEVLRRWMIFHHFRRRNTMQYPTYGVNLRIYKII